MNEQCNGAELEFLEEFSSNSNTKLVENFISFCGYSEGESIKAAQNVLKYDYEYNY